MSLLPPRSERDQVRRSMRFRQTARPPPLPVWKRVLYGTIVVSFVLISVEGITRFGDLDRRLFSPAFKDSYEKAQGGWWRLMAYDPVLYWTGRPFARLPGTDEFLNARGFRGTDFSNEKPASLQRVVCMGDSATFGLVSHGGMSFTFTPTYSSELQRLLNDDGFVQQVEVINTGIIGYATPQGLRLLKHEVRHWQPDVITIRYGINDHLRKSYDYRPASEPRNALLRWGEDSLLDLRTTRLLLRLIEASKPVPTHTAPQDESLPTTTVELRVPLADFEYNLQRLVTEGRAAGANVVLMTAPLAPLVPEITSDLATLRKLGFPSYEELLAEHARYEDVVRKVATDLNTDLLDSSRDLASRGLEHFFTRHDLAHPSGEGHTAIAKDLAALIRAKHLLR